MREVLEGYEIDLRKQLK